MGELVADYYVRWVDHRMKTRSEVHYGPPGMTEDDWQMRLGAYYMLSVQEVGEPQLVVDYQI